MRNFLLGTPYEGNAIQRAWGWIQLMVCLRVGHKVVNTSDWFGPDSGGEGFECVRCGTDWEVSYY
jgi:hypothetical protein